MRTSFAGLALAAAGMLAAPAAEAQNYPFRDITTVVVWGAGGGTDVINRMFMAEMERHLPVSITVTNITGGVAGSNGMVHVMNQPADGYTLAGIADSNVTAAVQGGFPHRFDYWHPFIIGGSPGVLSVNADAPWQTLEELIAAAQEAPGTIPAGASGSGSIHHLNLIALEQGTDTSFRFVPYPGSAPAQEAAVTGEVQVIATSLAEQQALIQGGQIRPLAMLVPEEAEIAGMTIPSAFDSFPQLDGFLPLRQMLGFAVPSESPAEVIEVLTEAFEAAIAEPAVADWAANNFYTIAGVHGAEAQALFAGHESKFAWALHELGIATVDPASLDIPQP